MPSNGPRAWPAFFLGHISGDYLWYIGIALLVGLGGAYLNDTLHRAIIGISGAGIGVLGVLFLLHPLRERGKTSPEGAIYQ